MQSPELLALTESDPLTLEQEYANQLSWAQDASKYCFIIHSRRPVLRYAARNPGAGVQTAFGIDYTLADEAQAEEMKQPVQVEWGEENEEEDDDEEETAAGGEEGVSSRDAHTVQTRAADAASTGQTTAADATATATAAVAPSGGGAAAPGAGSNFISTDGTPSDTAGDTSSATAPRAPLDPGSRWPLTPIGDVNLFLHADFNLGDYGITGGGCELEIMIAREEYRARGLATEAIRAIMRFSERRLGVSRFVAKVLRENTNSVALFEKKLGFAMIEYVECFDECVFYKDTSIGATEDDDGEEEEEEEEEEEGEQIEGKPAAASTSAPPTQTASQPAAAEGAAADALSAAAAEQAKPGES